MAGRDPFDFQGRAPGTAPGAEPVRAPGAPPPGPPGPSGTPRPPTPPGPTPARFERLPRGAAGPPVGWLAGALVVAAAAAAGALLLGDDVGVAFLCWVLAGPAAIGLVAVFVLRDTHARSRPLYIRPPWIAAFSVLTALAVAAGIAASAWRIADWWGRL